MLSFLDVPPERKLRILSARNDVDRASAVPFPSLQPSTTASAIVAPEARQASDVALAQTWHQGTVCHLPSHWHLQPW